MDYTTNAKKEFLEHTEEHPVLCAQLWRERWDTQTLPRGRIEFNLPPDYTEEELEKFLESINFNYDSGYGGQNLNGFIWYKDGTWSERGEYDGSEWWEYKSCPPIPIEMRTLEN